MYGPIFESMFTGSMYGSGPINFAVLTYAVASCNKFGRVDINPQMLGHTLGCSADEITKALDYLGRTDDDSRSKELGGVRLLREGQFQFLVVNYEFYQQLLKAGNKAEYDRCYTKAKRDAERADKATDDSTVVQSRTESSTIVHGDVNGDVNGDRDVSVSSSKKHSVSKRFKPPTPEEVQAYIKEKEYTFDPEAFHAYYDAQGWKLSNGNPMKRWQSACVTWQKREPKQQGGKNARPETDYDAALYR